VNHVLDGQAAAAQLGDPRADQNGFRIIQL
jgi:hypothetical protein